MIVDDHAVVRRGFCSMLRSAGNLFTVEEACEGQLAVQMFRHSKPDLVLLDATMPELDGIEVTRLIHNIEPAAKILIVTEMEEDFLQAFRVGASGCILKNVESHELLNAVGLVLSGYLVFGRAITKLIIENYHLAEEAGKYSKLAIHLTEREREILSLISQEFTNIEIAERLFISPRTVDSHRARLMQKLGTRNTAGLVRIAMEYGLLYESKVS
ncbi:MAG: response regulator transcription factor [Aphanocapsa lilacina HA4352-LM1]|nr:response regulator transcription factor [Aphanocapsa lilacina HA4352-LM1]